MLQHRDPSIRIATQHDLPALRTVMARAIGTLQAGFLSPDEVAASAQVMGLDTQLVADGTYFVAELEGRIAGCGGWSRRATLYGGDAGSVAREPWLLDPASEPARVRAMYTDPDFIRRGVGRAILGASEVAARAAGFATAELMATLAGEPLYRACGYREIERIVDRVPLVRMRKRL